jgi:TolA-binding protein
MKVYFCDVCNQSIPLADLKEDRATTIQGKLFCQACNPLNTLPPAHAGGGARLLGVLALVLLAVLGALGFQGYRMLKAELEQRDREVTNVTAQLHSLQSSVSATSERADKLEKSFAERARVDALEAKLAQQVQLQEKTRQDVSRLEELIGRLNGLQEKVTSVELQQQQMGADITNLRSDMEGIAKHLEQTIDRSVTKVLQEVASMGGGRSPDQVTPTTVADVPAGGGKNAEPAPIDDATSKVIQKLTDKDSGKRWEALDDLASRRDRRFLPYIMPMLKDADTFVQLRAIMAVTELGAREAVPELIALLRDSDPIVREEAMLDLVRLTGVQNLQFNANASAEEREKAVKQWEDWYAKNKDKYQG